MAEKKPLSKSAMLQKFMQHEHERLSGSIYDSSDPPDFSADVFFKTIDSVMHGSAGGHIRSDDVSTLLDEHVPLIISTFERKGYNSVRLNLVKHWVQFLNKYMTDDRDRTMRTLVSQSESLLADFSTSDPVMAFNTLLAVHNLLVEPKKLKEETCLSIAQLVTTYAPEVYKGYINLAADGLDYQDYKTQNVNNEQRRLYYSYPTNIALSYRDDLKILENTATPEEIFAFIKAVMPCMIARTQECKAGYGIVKDKKEKRVLKKDAKNVSEFWRYSITAAGSFLPQDQLEDFIIDHGVPLMEAMLYDKDFAHYQCIYNECSNALKKYPDACAEFAAAYGARSVVDLMRCGRGHEAATMLQYMRLNMGVRGHQAMLVFDPRDKQAEKPVALIYDSPLRLSGQKRKAQSIAVLFSDNVKNVSLDVRYELVARLADAVCARGKVTDIEYERNNDKMTIKNGTDQNNIRTEIRKVATMIFETVKRKDLEQLSEAVYTCPRRELLPPA